MKNLIKNWKTTIIGISAVFVGIKTILTTGSINEAITSIMAGIGLIFAKDGDQTGTAQ